MHIIFGMVADGATHPAHPGPASGAVAAAVLGPFGMLDLLAGQLGLSGPPVHPLVRVAAWQAKLEAASGAIPRFYSKSLAVDAISTARTLLSWRDDLVEAGWVPSRKVGSTGRVGDLAAAEHSPPPLPRGRQDLMREVLVALAERPPLDLDRIDVIEPLALLPPAWRHLFGVLAAAGVAVAEVRGAPCAAPGRDLGRLQRSLAGSGSESLVGDGSVTFLESRTAIGAAEAVADWMAQRRDGLDDTVFVVPDGDGGPIDQALARRGLPVLGASRRSGHRGALQLLSLAFAVAWSPFDPKKLLELLLLPRPPIEPWAARLLSDALCREPGVGGRAWTRAWDAVHAGLREQGVAEPEATTAEWRGWTEVGVHDRATGIPVEAAAALCDRVRRWALAADAGARDPLLLRVLGAADALSSAFAAHRRPLVPATQVERMVDLAIGEGMGDPSRHAEEGAARWVTQPGAVWGGAGHLVWWAFSSTASAPRRPWTADEAAELAATGCDLESDADVRRREAAHWAQAVRATGGALVLVTPSSDRGAVAASHPFAQRLGPMLAGDARQRVHADADALLARGTLRLAGSVVRRPLVAGLALPRASAAWPLPSAMATAVTGRHETASSLQDLMDCQFRWLLRHVSGLRASGVPAIPEPDRLLGDVAHALAQCTFPIGEVPDPAEVRRLAVERVDGLVDSLAAPLRLPGCSNELSFARSRVPDALASLARTLSERRLSVVALETSRVRAFGALSIRSRIDMVVRRADGAEAVIDLKWTRSRIRRRREVERGRAVQLATYGRLVAPGGGAPAGYYLLRQRELLAEAGSWLAPEGLTVERGLDETWEAVVADWAALAGAARSGRGLAVGLSGADEHLPPNLRLPSTDEVCAFCDLRRVCRVEREA